MTEPFARAVQQLELAYGSLTLPDWHQHTVALADAVGGLSEFFLHVDATTGVHDPLPIYLDKTRVVFGLIPAAVAPLVRMIQRQTAALDLPLDNGWQLPPTEESAWRHWHERLARYVISLERELDNPNQPSERLWREVTAPLIQGLYPLDFDVLGIGNPLLPSKPDVATVPTTAFMVALQSQEVGRLQAWLLRWREGVGLWIHETRGALDAILKAAVDGTRSGFRAATKTITCQARLRRTIRRSRRPRRSPASAVRLLGRILYGEQLASPVDTNHRGQVYRVYDGAGVATSLAFDFEGHPVSEQRQLVLMKTTQPDWSALLGESIIADMATAATALLDAEMFSASSQHDALGRVLTAVSPDASEAHYSYDEGGGLQTVELDHRGSQTLETVIGDITYDAKGRREQVVHGSTASPSTTTKYTYDPLSQRLTRLRTVRHSDNAALQSLHYHYDPVGNITDIRDTAQQTVYFKNTVVEAANAYEYDALYRLVKAKGREHATQGTTQRTHEQLPVGAQPMSSDPSAMRRYTQKFSYDSVGNILRMQHIPADGTGGWTRHYEYDTDGNRLLATSAPGDDAEGPYTHTYSYDAHGSMTTMPHLPSMVWNHDNELQEVTAGAETVYFQYAGGSRSRKFTEAFGGTTEERIYLGPFEIYRKHVNDTLKLERESLHISDGSGRICIVETKTVQGGPVEGPTGIWRYQHSNHLGSATTEVDGSGAIISYEEYHPYGTSAYRAEDSSIEVSAKRYRYTGMEQDEETGLAYHSARYYANWLGRWTSADPIGLAGGINQFRYATNPVSMSDHSGTTPVVQAEDSHSREAVWVGKDGQPIQGVDSVTVIEFSDAPLLTAEEMRPHQQGGKSKSLPKASGTSSDYSEINDIQVTSTRPLTVKELCAGDTTGVCGHARDNSTMAARMSEMERSIGDSQMMGFKGMAAYTVALAAVPLAAGAAAAGAAATAGGQWVGAIAIAYTSPGVFMGTMGFIGAIASGSSSSPTGRANAAGRASGLGFASKTPWKYGRLTDDIAGVTDDFGNITIRPGTTGQQLIETVRHEAVHRFLSATTEGPLQNARASFGIWGYHNSHLLRYTEEALAEGIATRSLSKGLKFPLVQDYGVSKGRLSLEFAGYVLGTAGLGHLLSEAIEAIGE